MMRHKRLWAVLIAAALLLAYLIIGAIAPFVKYSELTEAQKASFSADRFRSGQTGPDRAMLLETAESALDERIRLINLAQERIILTTFDMREGASTEDLASLLICKADQGVPVEILVDGLSGMLRAQNSLTLRALASHENIVFRFYNPINLFTPWTSQGRMHDKILIVDDKGFILGGRNTFDYFLGSYESAHKSLDREVLIWNTRQGENDRESSLFQAEEYYMQLLQEPVKTFGEGPVFPFQALHLSEELDRLRAHYQELQNNRPDLFAPFDYSLNTHPTNSVQLLTGPTGIYSKEPVLFYQLTQLMKTARTQVTIHTPYAVCNDFMYEQLSVVAQAVPETTLMLNSVDNGDNMVASSDYLHNKKDLIQTGLSIYEYDGGSSYHGKSVTIDDDISVIGSYNFDLRSTYMDTESMLVIQSKELTAELQGYMDALRQDCRKVTGPDTYQVPEGLEIRSLPGWKRSMMYVFGWVLQGFRYLV